MALLTAIKNFSEEQNSPFLVIGGHALISYGNPRQTADLDFLVPRVDAPKWKGFFQELEYVITNEQPPFLQFTPPINSMWPVDLMLVSEQTFAGMNQSARIVQHLGGDIRVPSLAHLMALKVHVLQQGLPHRQAKDLGDLKFIMDKMGISTGSPEFETLCLRYGSTTLLHDLRRKLA